MDWMTRIALVVVLLGTACTPSGPQTTVKQPVTDTYHGVEVVDDYRWLEDWDDLQVQQWSDEQNQVARAHLEVLPGVAAIRERVGTILRSASVDYRGLTWRPGALFAYSPYHNVVDGESYPAVLFMTGANDPRVDPMQSRKMTSRLQAATSGEQPILLRTSADTGHGGGTPISERIEEETAIYAFLFDQLGVEVGG